MTEERSKVFIVDGLEFIIQINLSTDEPSISFDRVDRTISRVREHIPMLRQVDFCIFKDGSDPRFWSLQTRFTLASQDNPKKLEDALIGYAFFKPF